MKGATGAVVGSNVVSLYDGINTQDREDIFDCLLHADAFASQHFDQRADYCNWLFRYRSRLEGRGWSLINPIRHTPQVIFQAKEFDAAAFSIIDSAGARALADLARASWNAMEVHHYADHFFDRGSSDGELARFQIVPCMNQVDGTLLMLICAIRLTGSIDTRDYEFWSETRREMLLRISGGVYRLDRNIYARYRKDIRDQLSSSADRAIKAFSI